jgi:hypothetical protein
MARSVIKKSEEPRPDVSELDAQVWSVVSFEKCEASGLSHSEAVKKLAELDAQKVSGLCIVTDDAAARVQS